MALVINSTGGSAVASNKIAKSLKSFCHLEKIKLYTFANDYALSGGYWLHCIGDETYAYKSSKIGSVGVVMTSLNFEEFLSAREIQRKYISSKSKSDK